MKTVTTTCDKCQSALTGTYIQIVRYADRMVTAQLDFCNPVCLKQYFTN